MNEPGSEHGTGLRARQGAATRELLVGVARELFSEHGYTGTAIDEVVRRAGVAKGALYHHFDGKQALFRAVYDAVLGETVSAVTIAAVSATDPWAGVRAGLATFLDACLEPSFRRIVVLDSVAVIQHEEWEGGIDDTNLPMLRTVLTPLLDAELLPGVATEPLAHVALGGLYGAALFIAHSADPAEARQQVDTVLDTIVSGLRDISAPPG